MVRAKRPAAHDRKLPRKLPTTFEELDDLLAKTWSDACDAELARASEEYKFLRAAVNAFDAVVAPTALPIDPIRPEKLNGLGAERALEFGKRVRAALEFEHAKKNEEPAANVAIGECAERMLSNDGREYEDCGAPAVIRSPSGSALCREHAQEKLQSALMTLTAVRTALGGGS